MNKPKETKEDKIVHAGFPPPPKGKESIHEKPKKAKPSEPATEEGKS